MSLTLQSIFALQSKYGVGDTVVTSGQISFESYLLECRRMLTEKTPAEYYQWDMEKQVLFTESLIIQFVNANKKEVLGYTQDGVLDVVRLIDDLKISILDYGVLRDALEDPEVQEIQINDYKTIWVVKGGTTDLYLDKKGNHVQFVSDEELRATLNRMTYNTKGTTPRMTVTDPLLNCRTARSGYRVSAVHSSAITSDMPPFDFPVTNITIRKYSKSRYTFDDFERFGTLTPAMARLLRLLGRADVRLFCVGPVSSGKTTLLNSIMWEVPENQRMILIQNPTEIMIYDRDMDGTNKRNVLHWEAQDIPEDRATVNSPTMANFIAHTLRNTPDVVVPGEMRTPEEFYQGQRVMKTGHRVMGTFHAEGSQDAVSRYATEVSSLGGGVSVRDAVQTLAVSIDIVVSQYKLADGSRRVMEISELTGEVLPNGLPAVNKLFEYRLTGEVDEDPVTKKVKKVHGGFYHCNKLSDKLIQKFYKAGVKKSDLDEFINFTPTSD